MDLSPYAGFWFLLARAKRDSALRPKPRPRKVRFASFPPKDGENFARFLARPLPTEPASLGFGRGPKCPPVREPAIHRACRPPGKKEKKSAARRAALWGACYALVSGSEG